MAPEIPELFPNPVSELLAPRFFALRDPPIIPSGLLPIGPRLLLAQGATGIQAIEDLFDFLTRIIQQMEVRGIFDVRRHTGSIDEKLAVRGRASPSPFVSSSFLSVGEALAINWAMASLIVPKLSWGNRLRKVGRREG